MTEALSLVVTTCNNADTLARCLHSAAALVDEIIVLDSYSDDDTLSIADTFNASIQQQSFKGFGPQKHDAIQLATHDWILLLDADEALTDALRNEIEQLKISRFTDVGYRLKRREWLATRIPIEHYGRWQRKGVKLTDHLRLFNRHKIRFTEHPVHAAPYTEQDTCLLENTFLHWGDAPFSHRLHKAQRYAEIIKSQQAGKPVPLIKKFASPIWAFLQDYILRRYFLDGYLGFRAALCSYWQTYWKYHPHK